METETGKDPKALPDEALDEAAGGLTFNGQTQPSDVSITDGTSNTAFPGTAKTLTKTGPGTLNFADGSVKPGA